MSSLRLKTFFTYFGGKHRNSVLYPEPQHETIIEPFAGSAGYALRHFHKKIILVDKSPIISGVWEFLTKASPQDVLNLPDIPFDASTDDFPICQEAKWLIGFWLTKGSAWPCKKPSSWMKTDTWGVTFWSPAIRQRIARQMPYISHWKIICGDYTEAPEISATWFIDPPYHNHSRQYGPDVKIDFEALGTWCQTRPGQVMVCETEGAKWLPFSPLKDVEIKHGSGRGKKPSKEVVWTNTPKPSAVNLFEELGT